VQNASQHFRDTRFWQTAALILLQNPSDGGESEGQVAHQPRMRVLHPLRFLRDAGKLKRVRLNTMIDSRNTDCGAKV
jgi:hypothetical protein